MAAARIAGLAMTPRAGRDRPPGLALSHLGDSFDGLLPALGRMLASGVAMDTTNLTEDA